MRDIIDKINEQRRISQSIIKYWNVNYDPTPFGENPQAGQEAGEVNSMDGSVAEYPKMAEAGVQAAGFAYEDTIEEQLAQEKIDQILGEKTERIENLILQQRSHRE